MAEEHGFTYVFIPGIKGTSLYSQARGQVWLSFKHVMGLSTPSLALPMKWSSTSSGVERQERDDIEPGAPLLAISFYKVYHRFCTAMSAKYGEDFHCFGYDWRRDNAETAELFTEYLAAHTMKYPRKRLVVIAHSMGGLITMAALHTAPEVFAGAAIVLAAVPLGTGVGFLEDYQDLPVGLNKKILSGRVLLTFPSPFAFLPASAEEGAGKVFDEGGEKDLSSQVDLLNVQHWIEHKLSIFAEEQDEQVVAHVQKCMDAGRRFRELVDVTPPGFVYPRIALIRAENRDTIMGVKLGGEQRVEFIRKPCGDGRVSYVSAGRLPEEATEWKSFSTSLVHSAVLDDHEALDKALQYVITGSPRTQAAAAGDEFPVTL